MKIACSMFPETKKARREDSGDSITTSEDKRHSGVIRLDVDKVSTLDNDGRFSPEVEVGGVHWKIEVRKQMGSKTKKYGLFVYLYTRKNNSTMWSIDVEAEHTLVHSDKSKNVVRQSPHTYRHHDSSWGGRLVFWEKLTDENKGYIKEDKITIEVRFSISNVRGIRTAPCIHFTDLHDPRNDMTLVINDKKVYVNKGILAFHSPVFNAMFFGDFKEKDEMEIALKEIDREEFLEMLRVIYPSYHKLTDSNVNFLLKLGDRFQIKLVLDLAEDHLITSTVPELPAKLLLSDQFRLIKLQNHCLEQLKTQKEVKALKMTSEYKDISDTTKVALLEKMFDLVPE